MVFDFRYWHRRSQKLLKLYHYGSYIFFKPNKKTLVIVLVGMAQCHFYASSRALNTCSANCTAPSLSNRSSISVTSSLCFFSSDISGFSSISNTYATTSSSYTPSNSFTSSSTTRFSLSAAYLLVLRASIG